MNSIYDLGRKKAHVPFDIMGKGELTKVCSHMLSKIHELEEDKMKLKEDLSKNTEDFRQQLDSLKTRVRNSEKLMRSKEKVGGVPLPPKRTMPTSIKP